MQQHEQTSTKATSSQCKPLTHSFSTSILIAALKSLSKS